MKKIVSWFLVLGFAAAMAGMACAQLEEKKAELEKVKIYIKTLDEKIVKARAQRKINKIAELKHLKRRELERAKKLRQEIASLEKVSPRGRAVGRPAHAGGRGRFQASAGYGGGGAMFGGGYVMPVGLAEAQFNAGLGIGNSYTVLCANVAGVFPLRNFYVGLEVGGASYSEKVRKIPGLSGDIDKGSRAGFGVFAGTKLGLIRAQVGYNSALGLTVGAIYRF